MLTWVYSQAIVNPIGTKQRRETMNIFEFMSDSPWLSFFLAWMTAYMIGNLLFRLPNRMMRHWNIRKHGYPPAHCDADGDFINKDKD